MIVVIGGLLFISALAYQLTTFVLFLKWMKKLDKPQKIKDGAPGLSVLVPIKGPNGNFKKTLLSLLNQNYPGPLEIILAFQERNDPDFFLAQETIELHAQKNKVKILTDLAPLGFNPKNSNLVHALRASQFEWIYCCDADTSLPQDHFSIAMEEARGRKKIYGTTISVHQNLGDLGAILQGVGTNFEMIGYFMFMTRVKKAGPINGAGMLFSKTLLSEIGGLESTLNFITDDLLLSKKLESVGAESFLIKSLGRVDLPTEKLISFWSRFRRWILIVRCFDKGMFYSAPFSWAWQWLFIFWIFTQNDLLLRMSLNLMTLRMIQSFIYQGYLKVGFTDIPKAIFLPLYDVMTPFLWFSSLVGHKVRWGDQTFSVESNGILKKISLG